MRARTAVTAAALAASAALTLTACGGGGSGDGDKISAPPTATGAAAPSASPTTAAPTGAALRIDPSLALPADLTLTFDWPLPPDRTKAVALTATANFMQAMVHGVVEQSAAKGSLGDYSTGDALRYAKQYVQAHVDEKKTLTGSDRYYGPAVELSAKNTVAEVTFCENDTKLYSKEIATGKVHYTPADDDSYTSYEIVLSKAPGQADLWRAQSVAYKERATQCEQ